MKTDYDHLEKHCPMLGHEIKFNYCRSMNNNLPCRKVLDCWFQVFPVQEYLAANFSEAEIAQVLAPARPKVATIIELIEKARASLPDK